MAVVNLMTEPHEVTAYLENLLSVHAGELGLAYVGSNAKLISEYPAVVLMTGPKIKTLHATHTFNVGLEVSLFVYHARLTASTPQRTMEDLLMVSEIENLIERDKMNFDGQVIFAYVRDILPGTATRPKGEQVIGTRMNVEILSQKRFPYVG